MKPLDEPIDARPGAPLTAPGLLRLAALVSVITLAPMVLWLSFGLHPAARAGMAGDGWPQAWALYGHWVGDALRLATACTAVVWGLAMPCAQAGLHSSRAWVGLIAASLQRPLAIPGLATALALVLATLPSQGPWPDFGLVLVAHLALALPFALLRIAAAQAGPARSGQARAEPAAMARAALSACGLAFALSLGESSLTALLDAPLASALPAGLATMRAEAGATGAAIGVAIALPLLWGLQAIADALGVRPVKPSWGGRS